MTSLLFVGNTPAIRARIAAVLPAEVRLDEATDPEAAQRVLTRRSHHLVIISVASEPAGGELVGWMRASGITTPVILLIPQLTKPIVLVMLWHRIDDYLLTSCTDQELEASVTQVLRRASNASKDTSLMPVVANAPAEAANGPMVPVHAALMGFDGAAPGATAAAMTEALEARGIQAYCGTGVLHLIRRDPWFVLIVARLATLSPGEVDDLRQLLYDRPTIKLIVIADSQGNREVQLMRLLGLKRVLTEPLDVDEVAAAAGRELADHHFDPRVVVVLRSCVPRILGDAHIHVAPALVQMRVSAQVLAPITALVEVAGADLVGRVMVSGDPEVLSTLARHWLGEEPRTRDALWDVVGELANRLAAEIRQHYYARGLTSFQGPPVVIEGVGSQIRQHSRAPSLVFSFAVAGSDHHVFVEWLIAHKSTAEFARPASTVAENDISFF